MLSPTERPDVFATRSRKKPPRCAFDVLATRLEGGSRKTIEPGVRSGRQLEQSKDGDCGGGRMHAHTILLITGGWAGVLLFTCSLLTVARRSDDAALRHYQRDIDALRADRSLADVARQVHWALGAERVTVVLAESHEPATGKVGACVGAPGLVGSRVRVGAARGTGVVRPVDALGLGLAGGDVCPAAWTFAHVPLSGNGHLVGAVTAASRSRTFTDEDLAVIERVARNRGRPFDRRRRRR
jgi:hypothetical protein